MLRYAPMNDTEPGKEAPCGAAAGGKKDAAELVAESLAEGGSGLSAATIAAAAAHVADELAGGEWHFGGWSLTRRRESRKEPRSTRGVTLFFWRPLDDGPVENGKRASVETCTTVLWDGEAHL